MAKKKVLADMDPLEYVYDEELKKKFHEKVDLDIKHPETLEDLLKLDLSQYWAMMRGMEIEHYVKSTEFFQKAENLIAIPNPGIGYDDIDVKAATEAGVIVTNTPGVLTQDVAEHTIMLMIAASKDVARSDKEVREGGWDWAAHTGFRLWGKTLGQIGLGKIGSAVAEKCRVAFNMRVLVYDPYAPDWEVERVGGRRVSLDELLREADFITINCVLTPETTGMIGYEEFKKMKRTAILVNTARGKVIKEQEMVRALNEKLIFAAGLDVFEEEPPGKDNPLLKCPNTVFTVHCASNTREGCEAMFGGAVKNLLRLIEGEYPKNIVNREVLERENLRFRAYLASLSS